MIDNNELDNIFPISRGIEKPTDYLHIRTLRVSLEIQNAWPGKELGEDQTKYRNFLHFAHCFVNVYGLLSSIMYLKEAEIMTFFELGHLYIVLFIFIFVTTCRILFTTLLNAKYAYVAVKFLKKMHLFYYKDGSEYALKTYRQVHYMCHYFVWYLLIQTYSGHLFFNAIPIWNNYATGKYAERNLQNRTYEHSIYLYYGSYFDIYRNFNSYIVGCILNWFISFFCSTLFCMLDVLLSIMVFHLWGHLKILLYDLDTFPLPAQNEIVRTNGTNETVNAAMYSEEELVVVTKKLKQCVNYHRLIKEFTDKVSEAFGPMLFFLYMFLQSSGCLLLLECSQMTAAALIRYFPLLVIIFQHLIQVSVIFELIGSTSEKLKDAVYGVPWQYMDTSNRKTLIIFMFFVQEPIHVKALGIINVGVTTMATVIKTSLSYFTFLRSM